MFPSCVSSWRCLSCSPIYHIFLFSFLICNCYIWSRVGVDSRIKSIIVITANIYWRLMSCQFYMYFLMKSTFWSTHYYYTNFIGEKTEAEASKQLSQDHQLGRTKSQTRCQIPETMLLITALLISILIKMLCMILSLSLSYSFNCEHSAHRQNFNWWKGSGAIFQVKSSISASCFI